MGVFDPSDNSFVLVDIASTISGSSKFGGAAAAGNGKVIFAPSAADGLGIFEFTIFQCDVSTAPTNGGLGNCTDTLEIGSTCTITCDAGYVPFSAVRSCDNGGVLRVPSSECLLPGQPAANPASLKLVVDACLDAVPSGEKCCSTDPGCDDPATARCRGAGCVDMPDWDVSRVTDMTELFEDRTEFNQDISRWNTSSVTSFKETFRNASSFDQDLSRWGLSPGVDFTATFVGADAFAQPVWTWPHASSTGMFFDAFADLSDESLTGTKLLADDGAADDYFGRSVSIDGDTMVVGAFGDGGRRGSAYVFTRATAGDLASGWTQVAKLTADDRAADDIFGYSVSIDGDTMVIGAHQDDDKGTDSGSAYVFTRDTAGDLASGWTQVAKLTAGDGAASDQFAGSVSNEGDTIVIGAYYDDDKGFNSGSAYVFTRTIAGDLASGWTQVAKLTADDGAADDIFGYSVSIDGDTMVIGALQDDDKGTSSGSAYVFTRDTAGDLGSGWTQVAKLTADDGTGYDRFGSSVSIDGDTVVVGAKTDDDKGDNSGSAFVFTRDTAGDLASGWTQVAKLTAGDGAASDQFAGSVSNEGDTIVIGAYYDDDKGFNSGSAYVFTRTIAGDLASGWTQVAKLTADDGAASDFFGWSVSIDGDTVVIGAYEDDDPVKGTNSGSAYVFTRDTAGNLASNWTQFVKLTAGDGAAGDKFGESVSIDGNTMVIAALGDDAYIGSAYVFSIHFPPCDASSSPVNGAVGDCTGHLASGSTCQPACDAGYAPIGPTVCDNGVLTPAVCSTYCDASAPPANGGAGN